MSEYVVCEHGMAWLRCHLCQCVGVCVCVWICACICVLETYNYPPKWKSCRACLLFIATESPYVAYHGSHFAFQNAFVCLCVCVDDLSGVLHAEHSSSTSCPIVPTLTLLCWSLTSWRPWSAFVNVVHSTTYTQASVRSDTIRHTSPAVWLHHVNKME